MKLGEVCRGIAACGLEAAAAEVEISAVVMDSRRVSAGALFICVSGAGGSGSRFIADALRRGAAAVVAPSGEGDWLADQATGAVILRHTSPEDLLPELLARFYGDPIGKIRLIGVTGTNGKTTTAYLVEAILGCAGRSCGVIGTVNYRFGGQVMEAKNTTPGLADNFQYLSRMAVAGVDSCVMEVSSHALQQGRVRGLVFEQAVFSNLTSDHLDYHRTREEYFLAKAKLFDGTVAIKNAVLNTDDPYGCRLKEMVSVPVLTYGIDRPADLTAEDLTMTLEGSRFTLTAPQGRVPVVTPMIGTHNVYNILAAAGACLNEGVPLPIVQQGIQSLQGVPGRLERIENDREIFIFVDYAHTEDALQNVLAGIRGAGAPRILAVFGCGGDRDKSKRPKMAAAVEQGADFAIVTSDNPRSEDPGAITGDIIEGFEGRAYEVILDRAGAIARAIALSEPGDCVLIAGKGHEDYQIFKDRTIHFDDREVARTLLKG